MVILGLVILIEREILQWQNFQNKSKITSDIAKISFWKRLYSTRNGDFRPCNSITYFKKREYSCENNVTRLMAKIVTQKEALIDKKWWF